MKNILLIDCTALDSTQITRYFTTGETQVGIQHLSTLEAVEDYIAKRAHVHSFRMDLPSLIILDVDFPNASEGLELLNRINTARQFANIPVFIFTKNIDKDIVANCYVRGANGYFLKPNENINFLGAVKMLTERWQNIIQRGFGYNYKAV